MNKVKILKTKSIDDLQTELNKFCAEHEVYATQFIPINTNSFIVAIWYREMKKGEVVRI